jgi:hypothetical protein
MQLAVRPEPIFGASTHHLCGLLPCLSFDETNKNKKFSAAIRRCQFPKFAIRLKTFCTQFTLSPPSAATRGMEHLYGN